MYGVWIAAAPAGARRGAAIVPRPCSPRASQSSIVVSEEGWHWHVDYSCLAAAVAALDYCGRSGLQRCVVHRCRASGLVHPLWDELENARVKNERARPMTVGAVRVSDGTSSSSGMGRHLRAGCTFSAARSESNAQWRPKTRGKRRRAFHVLIPRLVILGCPDKGRLQLLLELPQ